MLFNSALFLLVFLPIVLVVYYRLGHRSQNAFLVVASCVFYASWDWRFLFALLFTTSIDYLCARQMETSLANGEPKAQRKKYVVLSCVTNLGLLGFFKYFNFFAETMFELSTSLGFNVSLHTFEIILPIGISFFTFQALSYTIDVYRGELHATKSFWDFFLAVLYFPHLVAGPIQRAANLLPQVTHPRVITREQGRGRRTPDHLGLLQEGLHRRQPRTDRRRVFCRAAKRRSARPCSASSRSRSRSTVISPATPTSRAASRRSWDSSSC